jgi:DNA-binding transcriptional regulator YiaG
MTDKKTNHRKTSNPDKKGSFEGLIGAIEADDIRRGQTPALTSAAFRAAAIVRTMRKSGQLSQQDLADRLGLSQARVSEIESGVGVQGPTWDLMERIAKACDSKILISPHDAGFAIDAAEFPEPATHWAIAVAKA